MFINYFNTKENITVGFRQGSFAKCWAVEPKSNTSTQLRISISRKNRETGEYEQDFSGFVSCVGTAAAKKAANLKEGDTIRLGDIDVSTTYNAERKITYTNYKIFSFQTNDEVEAEKNGGKTEKKPVDEVEPEPVEEEPDLPF